MNTSIIAKQAVSHARSFLRNDYHFSATAAAEAKKQLKNLSLKNGKGVIEFLQSLPDIHFTDKGAKAEAQEIISKLQISFPVS